MAMHLPGVAVGLDVVAWHPPDKSVVIYPGVAVDSDGNTIVVGESQRFQLKTQDAGTAYFTLRYREVPQEMTQAPGEEEPQPAYILEAYVLEDRRQVPGPDEIELARIDISGSDSPISDASNLQSPGQDEIDLRFRSVSGPRQLGDVAIDVLPLESGPGGVIRHLPGSASLVRAINATTSYRARFKGVVSLGEDITDCDLLVVAGKAELSLTDDWVSVLRRFLDRGGVLMGERCAGVGKGSGEPFQRSFLGLVDSLGESLSVPDRQHPLMNICHNVRRTPRWGERCGQAGHRRGRGVQRRRLRVSLGWSRPGRDWPRVHPVGSGARDQPRCILLTPRLIASSQVGGRVAATEPKWGWMSDNISLDYPDGLKPRLVIM